MATITIKNIPEQTYRTLKALAAENHRSINNEVINLIDKATKSIKIDPGQHLVLAKKFRDKTKQFIVTNDKLAEMKNEGRL